MPYFILIHETGRLGVLRRDMIGIESFGFAKVFVCELAEGLSDACMTPIRPLHIGGGRSN